MPLALPLSRMMTPSGPVSMTACRREHLGSLRTRSLEGSRPTVATLPSRSTSWAAPLGYWTRNLSRPSDARGILACRPWPGYHHDSMITADPGRRAARLEELKQVLARRAAPED